MEPKRRRKQYKFARFAETANCFEAVDFAPVTTGSDTIVELGAGSGLFALELALRYPARLVLAVDVKADRLYRGARAAITRGAGNIRFVRAHAEQLPALIGDKCLGQLWLTFPDPYPKKRQAKHRLSHPRLLALYARLLSDSGRLHCKTDNRVLFEWSLESLAQERWRLEFVSFDLTLDTAPADFELPTTYERRYRAEGRRIYGLSVSRASWARSQSSRSPAPIASTSLPS